MSVMLKSHRHAANQNKEGGKKEKKKKKEGVTLYMKNLYLNQVLIMQNLNAYESLKI